MKSRIILTEKTRHPESAVDCEGWVPEWWMPQKQPSQCLPLIFSPIDVHHSSSGIADDVLQYMQYGYDFDFWIRYRQPSQKPHTAIRGEPDQEITP